MKKGRRRIVVGIAIAVLTIMTVMKVFRSVTLTKPDIDHDVDADRQREFELFALTSNHHHHLETTRRNRNAQESDTGNDTNPSISSGSAVMTGLSGTNHQTWTTKIIHNSTTTTVQPSLSSLCFALNSPAWLNGRRHENAHDPATDTDEQRYQRHERVHDQLLRLSQDLLEDAHSILNQSICHDSSRFLQFPLQNRGQEKEVEVEQLDNWVARLVYLAIYHHQHAPALAEARHYVDASSTQQQQPLQHDAPFPQRNPCLQARYSGQSDNSNNLGSSLALGAYDYECPDTKYLGVTLWDQGIGANVQFIAVPALLAGLATNRTVVFINNARAAAGSRSSSTSWVMRKPWSLASCYTPRRDHQCFFAPLSPCVPTDQELSDAVALNKTQKMQLFQDGILPAEYQNEKFVYMLGLQKFPNASLGGDKVQKAVHRIVHHLIDQHEFHAASSSSNNKTTNSKEDDARFMSLLRRAADRILRQEIDGKKGKSDDDASVGNNVTSAAAASISTSRSSPRFHYRFDNSRIHHALALYALRPNESNQQKLQTMLRETLERHQHAHPDHQPQQPPDIHISSVGLPVRASDKCLQESECLSLEQYMWAVRKAWHTFGPNVSHSNNGTTTLPLLQHPPTIIFTTESTDMQEAQRRFVANQRQEENSNVTTSAVVAHHYQEDPAAAPAWTMMTNDVDVTPDSGRFKPLVALERNVTAEEAMLSAISTLRLQLLARVTVGNCCSNFHTLLRNLFMEGCGATRDHYFHCLQDDDEPELRMCCFKSKSCIAQREKEIRERSIVKSTPV